MPKWTVDQKSAIEENKRGVVVSAAAGSGKTAVLVERTIQMLSNEENHIEADTLLAVTFTNAAASQMREKLSNALAKEVQAKKDNAWILNQQTKLQYATISTINSFCLNFVKDHIELFDLESNFRIMEETEEAILFDEATDKTLLDYYENKPEEIRSLREAFCIDDDENIKKLIKELHKFFSSMSYEDIWINKVKGYFKDGTYVNYVVAEIKKTVKEMINDSIAMLNSMITFTYMKFIPKSVLDVIESDIELIDELSNINGNSLDEIIESLNKISFKRYPTISKKEDPEAIAASEVIKEFRNIAKKNILGVKSFFVSTNAELAEDVEKTAELFTLLCDITKDTEKVLNELKIEANAASFSDVERMTVNILTEINDKGEIVRTDICKDIIASKRFKMILVDEFQDVNNLQALIMYSLSNSVDVNTPGNNLFIVGDIKQSIYRFRQANPLILREARDKAKNDENLSAIALKKNFRSRKEIVDIVNFIFSNLMSEEIGDVDYTDTEQLVLGAKYDEVDNYDTEILMIKPNSKFSVYLPYSYEELTIAKRIKELINNGMKTLDAETNELRPSRPSDYCVLVRGNKRCDSMSKALQSVGLNSAVESQTGYLKSREISVIINLLKVIDNPMADIPLLSVLMSPIFMFSADDITMIRAKHLNGANTKKLYQNIIHYRDSDNIDEVLKKKCAEAIDSITRFRYYSAGLTLVSLIRKIYDETDYYGLSSTYEDSHQKRANLSLFLEYANDYENSSDGGLTGFIRHIDKISQTGKDFNSAAINIEDENCVNIMTMHKSKGLEYPFVFLCDIFHRFNIEDVRKQMIINNDYGVAFKFYDEENHLSITSQAFEACKLSMSSEMKSEELRLLYVAVTRTREKLFIPLVEDEKLIKKIQTLSGTILPTGKITNNVIKSANCIGDWILSVLLLHPDCGYLRDFQTNDMDSTKAFTGLLKDLYFNKLLKTSSKIDFNFINEDIDETTQKSISYTIPPNEKLVERIKEIFDFRYDKSLSQTPSKLSVSDVAKDKDKYFYPQIPKFNKEIGKLTAAEKGTITHSFMELCDFKKAEQSVTEEISRLVIEGKMTDTMSKGIDIKTVEAFFNSDIYKEIKNSSNIMREKQFLVKLSDIKCDDEKLLKLISNDSMLQGIADCIYDNGDGYTLLDYKTDRNVSEEELINRYTVQLDLYELAFNLILDKKITHSYIYSFSLKKGIKIL